MKHLESSIHFELSIQNQNMLLNFSIHLSGYTLLYVTHKHKTNKPSTPCPTPGPITFLGYECQSLTFDYVLIVCRPDLSLVSKSMITLVKRLPVFSTGYNVVAPTRRLLNYFEFNSKMQKYVLLIRRDINPNKLKTLNAN